MKLIIMTLLFLAMMGLPVLANCKYNGTEYPTGTEIGGLKCQADGHGNLLDKSNLVKLNFTHT